MKPALPFFICFGLLVCASFAAEQKPNPNWKVGADGTRVMHSDDAGQTWKDVSPPALVAVTKNVNANATPEPTLVPAGEGIPAPSKGPLDMVEILAALSASEAHISIVIKPPANGKPAELLYERTTDGGRTWWKEPPDDPLDNDPKPPTLAVAAGWWQEVSDKETKTMHTTDGGKHWFDVSPLALKSAVEKQPADQKEFGFFAELAELDPLDGQRAWLAFQPADQPVTVVEYTADGGQHWHKTTAPVQSDDVQISFLDEEHGFLIQMGGHGIGPHAKRVYGTSDGGKTWKLLGDVPGSNFIVSGIAFRNTKEGWITGEYHGEDFFPLYRTVDGGKTWKRQKFPVPADYTGGYANTESPVFSGREKLHGILPVHLVRHNPAPDHHADVKYESDDGGATWHLPASGVKSVSEVPDE